MRRVRSRALWASLALGLVVVAGCANSETTTVMLVSHQPVRTRQGVRLAVIQRGTLAYYEEMENSPNVKSVTRITNFEETSAQIGPPVTSPVGDVVVYPLVERDRQRNTLYSNLWRQVVGSPSRTPLTQGRHWNLFPAFTPDGKQLVFSSGRTSRSITLCRINIEGGGGITQITNSMAEDYSPSVSPDGEIVAYASLPPGAERAQVWTVQKNGSLPTQLREGNSPQLSPDGKRILFVRRDASSGAYQIWLMNVDATEETQLTQNTDHQWIHPRWSPDGKWIVLASNEGLNSYEEQNYDIWLMTADGRKKTQLTTNGSRDDAPCWDRTGKSVYFRSNRGGRWNIWRFDPVMP